MTNNSQNTHRKPELEWVKVVPLGDELNQLQTRLGGLRRQTGRLTDTHPRVQTTLRASSQG